MQPTTHLGSGISPKGECERLSNTQRGLNVGERKWLEFLQVLQHWRRYDIPRPLDGQIADVVARRDGRNQLGGGDLVAPKARPAEWAIGPRLHGGSEGERAVQCLSSKAAGIRLVMSARMTCRCGPIGSVKHTAGRTLVADRSSNGKGTRTTLPLVIKRLPIGQCVDVFFGFFKEIEGWVACCGLKPLLLVYVGLIRDQDDDADSTGADKR
jgi:hypothetical protein